MSDVARAVECPVWAPPLLALQFLTRVPVPLLTRLPRETVEIALGRSVGWFPLVGAFVGALTGATALAAEQIWPRVVAVLIALAIEALITGAFHEDAVADFFDGIGGGRDPAHARQIMKDSRIGSYGALGLMLAVALRATLMVSLPLSPLFFFVAVVAAAAFGRLTASVAMSVIAPAPQSAPGQITSPCLATRIGAALPPSSLAVAAVTAIPALLPFGLLAPSALLLAFAGVATFLIWFRSLLLHRLGGITGDCLGLAVYAGQLIVLLVAAAS
jgi:adenosylcobinamide-GDP ribazoletransferase